MFIGTSISESPTIVFPTGAELTNAGGRFVKVTDGGVTLCGTGEPAIGLLLLQTPDVVAKGENITVQIKERGQVIAGGTFVAGDYLASDADGKAVKATTDAYVLGVALEDASVDGIAEILLVHGGKSA